jgi:CRP-like cAMP-binding protein
MPLREKPRIPFENLILGAIPRNEYLRLSPYLELIRLPAGSILYGAGDVVSHVYFPRSGIISLLSVTEAGATVEVGMAGNEGVVGLSTILKGIITPYQVVVRLQTNAIRVPANVLRAEFNRGGMLQALLLRYTDTLITQLMQSAACNRFHSMSARLCRWLLVSQDHTEEDTLYLTQEFLSQMIGAPRSRVSIVAGSLQRAGIIRYSRGRIRILDRRRLEESSCECYRIVREQTSHFLVA